MAQINILAKFLSQALEWKVRFPKVQFFAGLRYEPFIYFWARRIFPDYSRLYPDNEELTQKLVKDLRNKNQSLLKIINPEMITPEQETANVQFETEAQLEQQQVAQVSPQEVAQPFSLSQPPTPHLPSMPAVSPIPKEEEPSTMVSKTEQPQPTIQTPKVPSPLVGGIKNFTSRAGVFFQRNVGKFLTVGNIATFASSVIGGVVGAGLTGGAPLGIFTGAGGGMIGRFWVGGGGGGQFLGRVGNNVINFGVDISNQASRLSAPNPSKKLVWGLLGAFFLFVIGAGLLGGLTGGGTSSQTGNVGIGATAALIPSGGTQPRPAAPVVDPSRLRQAIIEKFGITMNGYDNDRLRWAWDKFWDVSNTKFISLVRGSVITMASDSRQVGCPEEPTAVYLNQYPETLFKYALTHELGHIIKNCPNSSASFVADFFNAFRKERGVTYYANNASVCTGSDNQSEDYAEMIALYLNPNANIQMVRCAIEIGVTRYTNLKTDFPLHYNVARSVLGDY